MTSIIAGKETANIQTTLYEKRYIKRHLYILIPPLAMAHFFSVSGPDTYGEIYSRNTGTLHALVRLIIRSVYASERSNCNTDMLLGRDVESCMYLRTVRSALIELFLQLKRSARQIRSTVSSSRSWPHMKNDDSVHI